MNKVWGIVNCQIITLDQKIPRADGLVIDDCKFQFVGSSSKVKQILGKGHMIIDLKGKTVIPGFVDSHTHLQGFGIEKKLRLNLSQCRSKKEVLESVKAEIEKKGKGQIIIGIDWDQSRWMGNAYEPKEVFCRAELDHLCPKNPLVLRRICGHIAFANRKALAMIGRGWTIVDRRHGLLLEDVVSKINQIFPPVKHEIYEAIRYAIDYAHSLGITSIHEMVDYFYFSNLLDYFSISNGRKIRVYANFGLDEFDSLVRIGIRTGFGNEFLRLGGIKVYADGSIGARTAALFNDYQGERGNRGLLLYPLRRLTQIFRKADQNGFQVLVHAIGDRAINQVINAFRNADIDRNIMRHRIEHIEVVTDKVSINQLQRLNLLVSLQPNFIGNWGQPDGLYERYLGSLRWPKVNRLRTLKSHGLKIIFGSDCMPPSPLYGIHWALNHPIKEEGIKLDDALAMYSKNGAYGSFEENLKGSITNGKLADFVVLEKNLDRPENIDKIPILLTVLSGVIVYKRPSFLNRK